MVMIEPKPILMVFVLEIKLKKYWKHIICMLPVFLFSFCSTLKTNDFSSKMDFVFNDLIIIPNVKINDHLQGDFIFDTGSNHTVIDSDKIKHLLNNSKKGTLKDFYGNIDTINITEPYTLKLFDLTIKNVKLRNYNLHKVLKKYNAIGIIGTDIISRFSWKFDFVNKKLTLSTFPYKNDSLLFFSVDYKDKCKVKDAVWINNIKMKPTIIDSGSLSEIVSNNFDLVKNDHNYYVEKNLINSLTSKTPEVYEIGLTNHATLLVNNNIFTHNKLQLNKNYNNIIGLDFFHKDFLVFDGVSSKVYFNKNRIKDNINLNTIGLRFDFNSEGNIIVQALTKNGLAEKIGIRLGDEVLQVNDIKVTNSINKLKNINKIRNQIETIIVKRKNEHLRFSLQ